MYRAATLAGRPSIVLPSRDLEDTSRQLGQQGVKDAVRRLKRSGRILSVRKNLVVLPEATGRVTVGLPEIIKVVAPSLHLITGGRALEESHLTDQHSFTVVVLVPAPVSGFSFRGEKATFLTADPARIWGWVTSGPHYALPERAILDGVSHPRYGVSLPMALGALSGAIDRDPDFLSLLFDAARLYDSTATSRRIGLLVGHLCGHDEAEPFRDLIGTSRTPVLLRPGGERKGQIDRTWRVIVNASIEPQGASN